MSSECISRSLTGAAVVSPVPGREFRVCPLQLEVTAGSAWLAELRDQELHKPDFSQAISKAAE